MILLQAIAAAIMACMFAGLVACAFARSKRTKPVEDHEIWGGE